MGQVLVVNSLIKENTMFTPDFYVDTVQNGKKQFIKKYMNHAELAHDWNKYVDAQTVFVQQALKTYETSFLLMLEKMMGTHGERLFNPLGIDWFQAGWDAAVKNTVKK